MPKLYLSQNVFDAALERLVSIYQEGHRIVVSFSGGKDSTVVLNLCAIAAEMTGRLPVEVAMRDEEIMFPGTFEYCERVYHREDIDFKWMFARQPVINIYNRECPYFWAFDPLLTPDEWMREPPPFAEYIPDQNIRDLISPKRYPLSEGQQLIVILGLRTEESMLRKMGLMSSGDWLTRPSRGKVSKAVREGRPIYDWSFRDVWKAIKDFKWDYNSAYDVIYRLGGSIPDLRIAPPTLAVAGLKNMQIINQAYPKFFNKLCQRLPGVRQAVLFGKRAILPARRSTETWEEATHRLCIDEAPRWIAERTELVVKHQIRKHTTHSTTPFPQSKVCLRCGTLASWRAICTVMYNGDPFSMKQSLVPYVEPEFFRQGAGYWGGKPTW